MDHFRWVRPGGEIMHLQTGTSATGDTDGSLALVGFALDITTQTQVNEALQSSKKLLAESQRLAHLGSWTLDLETNEFIFVD